MIPREQTALARPVLHPTHPNNPLYTPATNR